MKWTHLPEEVNAQSIRLFCQEGSGPKRMMTPQEYRRMTASTYVEENVYDPRFIIKEWIQPHEPHTPFIFEDELRTEFLRCRNNPPMNVLKPVTHDCEGRRLSMSIGLGVFPTGRSTKDNSREATMVFAM